MTKPNLLAFDVALSRLESLANRRAAIPLALAHRQAEPLLREACAAMARHVAEHPEAAATFAPKLDRMHRVLESANAVLVEFHDRASVLLADGQGAH
jgi:hypothetical protein